MEIEFIQGAPLKEGEAFILIEGKEVKHEIIDRFNSAGQYVGERPSGLFGKLVVNLYKVSIETIDRFNEHVPGIKIIDIDNSESFIELALIPSTVHHFNGKNTEDWYVSERLSDKMYSRPSKLYLAEMQKENRNWGKSEIDENQSN